MQVAEQAGDGQPIARAATSIAAFVGRALRGPLNRPVTVTSFADFQATFGGLWQPSMLSYAIEQYFENGGQSAVVVRVINGGRAPTLTLPTHGRALRLVARNPGTREYLRAAVDYDSIPPEDSASYNLTLQRLRAAGSEHVEDQEIYRRVSGAPDSPRNVEAALADSMLARVDGRAPPERPLPTTTRDSGYVASSPDGNDGNPLTDYDLIGSAVDRTGLFALSDVEEFNFLCLPPLSRAKPVGPGALMVAGRYCRQRGALLLMDPPAEWADPTDALAGVRDLPVRGEDTVMFYPRVLAYDRLRGRFEPFAPSAAAAAMFARLDQQDPAWGPLHELDAVLRPGLRPVIAVGDADRERLAGAGINVLLAARPKARLGARTLGGAHVSHPDWCHLATKRFALMLANSIERGTRWSVFYRSEPALWAKLAAQVSDFFHGLEAEGRFAGGPEGPPWFVVCDRRLNTPGMPGARLLYGFAARRAGDYHAFVVSHGAGEDVVKPVTLNRLHAVGGPLPAGATSGLHAMLRVPRR